MFLLVLWTGLVGIDFGYHWDEKRLLDSVRAAVDSGRILPGWYDYGSVSFHLALAAVVPDAVRTVFRDHARTPEEVQAGLKSAVSDAGFPLRVRSIFLFLTHLTFLPVGLAVYVWRKDVVESALASCIFLSLWEVQYQARWIAPDGIMMFWATVALLCIVSAVTTSRFPVACLRLGAIAGGLALASKYPGGLVVVPLLFATRHVASRGGRREYLRVLAFFFGAFIVANPGALLEPARFAAGIAHQVIHYGQTGHGAYTVGRGAEHMTLMALYLVRVVFAHVPWVSVALCVVMVVGIYDVVKSEKRPTAALLLMFPVLYLLYFSTQKVMIVRNLLVLLPYCSILAARGCGYLIRRVPSRPYRAAAAAIPLAAIAFNLSWLVTSGRSIEYRSGDDASRVSAYLEGHRDARAYLSPGVKSLLPQPLPESFHTTALVSDADVMLFRADEMRDNRKWIINRPGVYEVVGGSREVNWDYYATWMGESPVLAVGGRSIRALIPWIE